MKLGKLSFSGYRFHLLVLCCLGLFCQANADITSELKVFQVSQLESGEDLLEPASAVAPGAIVEYRAIFTNTSDSEIKSVNLEIPVPEQTRYIPSSDAPMASQFVLRDDSVLKNSEAVFEGDQVSPDLVGSVAWSIASIAAGESVELKIRVRISE